jgi:hypothetical protein
MSRSLGYWPSRWSGSWFLQGTYPGNQALFPNHPAQSPSLSTWPQSALVTQILRTASASAARQASACSWWAQHGRSTITGASSTTASCGLCLVAVGSSPSSLARRPRAACHYLLEMRTETDTARWWDWFSKKFCKLAPFSIITVNLRW